MTSIFNLHRKIHDPSPEHLLSDISDCENSSSESEIEFPVENVKYQLPLVQNRPRFTKSQIRKHFGVEKKPKLVSSTPIYRLRKRKSECADKSVSISPIFKDDSLQACQLKKYKKSKLNGENKSVQVKPKQRRSSKKETSNCEDEIISTKKRISEVDTKWEKTSSSSFSERQQNLPIVEIPLLTLKSNSKVNVNENIASKSSTSKKDDNKVENACLRKAENSKEKIDAVELKKAENREKADGKQEKGIRESNNFQKLQHLSGLQEKQAECFPKSVQEQSLKSPKNNENLLKNSNFIEVNKDIDAILKNFPETNLDPLLCSYSEFEEEISVSRSSPKTTKKISENKEIKSPSMSTSFQNVREKSLSPSAANNKNKSTETQQNEIEELQQSHQNIIKSCKSGESRESVQKDEQKNTFENCVGTQNSSGENNQTRKSGGKSKRHVDDKKENATGLKQSKETIADYTKNNSKHVNDENDKSSFSLQIKNKKIEKDSSLKAIKKNILEKKSKINIIAINEITSTISKNEENKTAHSQKGNIQLDADRKSRDLTIKQHKTDIPVRSPENRSTSILILHSVQKTRSIQKEKQNDIFNNEQLVESHNLSHKTDKKSKSHERGKPKRLFDDKEEKVSALIKESRKSVNTKNDSVKVNNEVRYSLRIAEQNIEKTTSMNAIDKITQIDQTAKNQISPNKSNNNNNKVSRQEKKSAKKIEKDKKNVQKTSETKSKTKNKDDVSGKTSKKTNKGRKKADTEKRNSKTNKTVVWHQFNKSQVKRYDIDEQSNLTNRLSSLNTNASSSNADTTLGLRRSSRISKPVSRLILQTYYIREKSSKDYKHDSVFKKPAVPSSKKNGKLVVPKVVPQSTSKDSGCISMSYENNCNDIEVTANSNNIMPLPTISEEGHGNELEKQNENTKNDGQIKGIDVNEKERKRKNSKSLTSQGKRKSKISNIPNNSNTPNSNGLLASEINTVHQFISSINKSAKRKRKTSNVPNNSNTPNSNGLLPSETAMVHKLIASINKSAKKERKTSNVSEKLNSPESNSLPLRANGDDINENISQDVNVFNNRNNAREERKSHNLRSKNMNEVVENVTLASETESNLPSLEIDLNTICYVVNNLGKSTQWYHNDRPELVQVENQEGLKIGFITKNLHLGFCIYSNGIMQLDKNCTKELYFSRNSHRMYTVLQGEVIVKLGGIRKMHLHEQDEFFVPLGQEYSILNPSKTNTLTLSFLKIQNPQCESFEIF